VICKAWLEGPEVDLYDLTRLFATGDTQIVKDGDAYYLASVEIDNRPEAEAVYEAAQRLLTLVNGVGQAESSSFRPVRLSGAYNEGDKRHVIARAETAEARFYAFAAAIVTAPDGTERVDSPPPGPERVKKAMRHPHAAEALGIMAKPEPTSWVDLYKVYEIIRDDMKPTSLDQSGWATKDQLSAFKASANRPDLGGPDSRHARMSGTAPKRNMPIAEARDFIGRLLTQWVDSLQ
jgi:hypothetical protein